MLAHVPSTTAGVEDVVAVLVLLTEFAMLRGPLLRSQVRLYAFQSLAVSVLAVVVAAISSTFAVSRLPSPIPEGPQLWSVEGGLPPA